jgi:hypothetical protein
MFVRVRTYYWPPFNFVSTCVCLCSIDNLSILEDMEVTCFSFLMHKYVYIVGRPLDLLPPVSADSILHILHFIPDA